MASNTFLKTVLAVLCMFAVTESFSLTATVGSVSGKTEIQNEKIWVALQPSDIIPQGKVIATDFKSQVMRKVGESVITVQSLTRLTLEQLTEKEGNHSSKIYLVIGSIDVAIRAIQDKKVDFSVSNSIATASVCGTKGKMFANGNLNGNRDDVTMLASFTNYDEKIDSDSMGWDSATDVSSDITLVEPDFSTETGVVIFAGETTVFSGNVFLSPQQYATKNDTVISSLTQKEAVISSQPFVADTKPTILLSGSVLSLGTGSVLLTPVLPASPATGPIAVTITIQ